SERIVARYDRVIRRGRRLDAMKETGKLHRLRIEGKKLRYLLEFFRDLYPVETVQPLIATLKNLQDHLGRFNDLQVQQKALASMTGRLDSSPDTRVAVEALLERLARKERRVRKRFAEE
ncbi:MAG: CHAD domain-containing protein, partial [Acidobacteria bacterium]|nr:CHAD domain-containing protein [Acidobacteriota bacterium]NIQ84158.1 CHAD domain-containing protein [Acidobacteriota bacterium]